MSAETRHLFRLRVSPPYDWARVLRFLQLRAVAGVESVDASGWRRTVCWPGESGRYGDKQYVGTLHLRPSPRAASATIEMSESLGPVAPAILAHLRKVLDADRVHGDLLNAFGDRPPFNAGLRVVGAFDGFEMAIRAVLGQQVSVQAARTLAGRFVQTFGRPLDERHSGWSSIPGAPSMCFPLAADIAALDSMQAAEDIRRLGVVGTRARTIVSLAQACVHGGLELFPGADPELTMQRLCALPGIGDWTAQYIAMRALCWPDAFPAGDLVVRRALGVDTPVQARSVAEQWRPLRAYAVMACWTDETPLLRKD